MVEEEGMKQQLSKPCARKALALSKTECIHSDTHTHTRMRECRNFRLLCQIFIETSEEGERERYAQRLRKSNLPTAETY